MNAEKLVDQIIEGVDNDHLIDVEECLTDLRSQIAAGDIPKPESMDRLKASLDSAYQPAVYEHLVKLAAWAKRRGLPQQIAAQENDRKVR